MEDNSNEQKMTKRMTEQQTDLFNLKNAEQKPRIDKKIFHNRA